MKRVKDGDSSSSSAAAEELCRTFCKNSRGRVVSRLDADGEPSPVCSQSEERLALEGTDARKGGM